ncbi:MAG TPA: superoxide dismutase [Anaerolineaceae bacterium]|nr:superoxide dismutase [Anaerolineaceae bacterium]
MPFVIPDLRYAFDALEPVIDARTVEIHYTKHHATYLKNLNTALEKYPQFFDMELKDILRDLSAVPEDIRTVVRNNGGGVYNHNVYWTSLAPTGSGAPKGKLAEAIDKTFGGFDAFKVEFEKSGLGRFGSGYAWLSLKPDKSLVIHSTANQDSPVMDGWEPIFVVDVWEHAYYLKYQNRRAEYLANIWGLINWEEAEIRYLAVK